jgi:hypothetical protein
MLRIACCVNGATAGATRAHLRAEPFLPTFTQHATRNIFSLCVITASGVVFNSEGAPARGADY